MAQKEENFAIGGNILPVDVAMRVGHPIGAPLPLMRIFIPAQYKNNGYQQVAVKVVIWRSKEKQE